MAMLQSNLFDKPSSNLKHVKSEDAALKEARVADPSPASTEIFGAMDIDMPSSSRVMMS